MSLKIELKPGERILIGECIITNDNQRTRLLIDGSVPILREKDIMTPRRADTLAKQIYLAVQLMYTAKDPRAHHQLYFSLVRHAMKIAPSMWPLIEEMNNHILSEEMYKALKTAKKLISHEKDLVDHGACSQSLRSGCEADRESARAGSRPAAQGRDQIADRPGYLGGLRPGAQ
jgi:flagellar biosynthesis repressor protein FlbT